MEMSRSRIVGGERMKRMSYILNSHDSIEDIRRRLLGLQLDREAVSLTLVPIRVYCHLLPCNRSMYNR